VIARRGFTLLEFVVVLAVMGIILAVTAPAFRARIDAPRDDAAGVILSLLQRARRTALETSHRSTVMIDPSTHRAWVTGRSAGGVVIDTAMTLAIPSDARLVASLARVRFVFSPDGSAESDALLVDSPRGRERIDVDRASGDARVTQGVGGTSYASP
jgi:prepilin-type N-terminal cleavage/methylation domain-containing protein